MGLFGRSGIVDRMVEKSLEREPKMTRWSSFRESRAIDRSLKKIEKKEARKKEVEEKKEEKKRVRRVVRVKARAKTIAAPEESAISVRECAACGARILATDRFCGYCGTATGMK